MECSFLSFAFVRRAFASRFVSLERGASKTRIARILGAGLVGAALLSCAALAKDKDDAPVFDVKDVVVTGALSGLQVWKTPNSVEVVTRAQIRSRRPLDAADALTSLPGVNVLRTGPIGSLTTLQIRGSGSTDVLVLQDGRPLNQPSVGNADLSTLPIDLIDHVEVVRGPYSALYGGNAMAGAVQIFTRSASTDPKSGADVTVGGQGTAISAGTASVKLGEGSLLVVPTVRSVQGFRPNDSSVLHNVFTRFSMPAGKGATLTLSGGLNDSRVGTPGPQPAADPALRTTSQRVLGNAQSSTLIDHQAGAERYATANWRSDRLWVNAWHSSWTPFFRNAFIDFTDALHTIDTTTRQYDTGIEARLRVPHLKASTLTLGALYEHASMAYVSSETDTGLGVSTRTAFSAGRDTRALYLEESLVLDRLSATLGLRGDNATGYGGQLSPRASVLYRPTDGLGLRGSWGRGFRAPTLSELYFPSSMGVSGNPSLRPQTSTTWELGLEAMVGRRGLLRVTWFNDDVKGLIAFAPVGPPGPFGNDFIPANLNRLRKRGFEVDARWQPVDALTLAATLTTLDAQQTNQEVVDAVDSTFATVTRPAANVPRTRATLTAAYRSKGGLWLQADGFLVGRRVQYYGNYDAFPTITYDTKTLASAATVDVTLGHKLRVGDVEGTLFLKVANVFDTKYALVFGNDINDQNFPMPGRTFYIGLSPRF